MYLTDLQIDKMHNSVIIWVSPFGVHLGELFCLFDLILYVPSTISQLNRDGSSWVEPVQS